MSDQLRCYACGSRHIHEALDNGMDLSTLSYVALEAGQTAKCQDCGKTLPEADGVEAAMEALVANLRGLTPE